MCAKEHSRQVWVHPVGEHLASASDAHFLLHGLSAFS